MVRDRWESQRKSTRNEALYKYVMDNPDATFEDVGREFNVTKQRAHEIYTNEEKKQAAGGIPAA